MSAINLTENIWYETGTNIGRARNYKQGDINNIHIINDKISKIYFEFTIHGSNGSTMMGICDDGPRFIKDSGIMYARKYALFIWENNGNLYGKNGDNYEYFNKRTSSTIGVLLNFENDTIKFVSNGEVGKDLKYEYDDTIYIVITSGSSSITTSASVNFGIDQDFEYGHLVEYNNFFSYKFFLNDRKNENYSVVDKCFLINIDISNIKEWDYNNLNLPDLIKNTCNDNKIYKNEIIKNIDASITKITVPYKNIDKVNVI